VMLVTKRAKFLARLGSRHRPSFRTLPNELQSKTVCQGNTLVPLDFGDGPQFILSYAGDVQVSRDYSPETTEIGRVRNSGVRALVYSVGRQRQGW
jgi:hypothetical protein